MTRGSEENTSLQRKIMHSMSLHRHGPMERPSIMQASLVDLRLLLTSMGESITWRLIARKARPWFDSQKAVVKPEP
jgi:hypothetical protein